MNYERAASERTVPRVAILETDPTGHRLQYVNHLVRAAGPERCVVLLGEAAMNSEECLTYARGVAARAITVPHRDSRTATLSFAVDAAATAGAAQLIIPEADKYLPALLLVLMTRRSRLALRIHLLLMRTPEVRGPEGTKISTLTKPALVQVLRLCPQVRVSFLTDAFHVVRRRSGYPGVRSIPDPVAQHDAPTRHRRPSWFPEVADGVAVVGVFGVISNRKNVPLLVEALRGMPSAVLVLGGRLEPDVRDFLNSDHVRSLVAAQRLTVVDRVLEPDEFFGALRCVDVVAVLHDNDAPSGVLAEACLLSTPVVVPAGTWLASVVDATGIGTATPVDAPSVRRAITDLVDGRERYVAAATRHRYRLGTAAFTDSLLSPDLKMESRL